ncbi:MAG: dihydrofolate reductase family protein [Candidatus Dojkabacteria bacterium]
MRKIIVSEMISIDGYYKDAEDKIEWHIVDEDFNAFASEFEKTVDTILFGRKTYQMFESYWPVALNEPEKIADDQDIAQFIVDAKKVVISKSLDKVTWNNSVLIKDNVVEEIKKLKEEEGKDIVVYGSGSIVKMLQDEGLIDEYIIIVSPTILGKGKSMFEGVDMQRLKLKETRKFGNGNFVLWYEK